MTTQCLISEIIIKDRIRKDLGNLIPLEKSIHKLGLLHPIVLSNNNELIAGQRRLEACKNLDWNKIDVNIIDLDRLQDGEIDENQIRKDFTSDEVLAIANYVEPQIKEETKVGRPKKGEESSQLNKNENKTPKKTREAVAEATGRSFDTIRKLKEIAQEAKTNPKFSKLYENIDNSFGSYKF